MRIAHVDLAAIASPLDGIGAVVRTLSAAQRAAGHDVSCLDAAWRQGASLAATAVRVIRVLTRGRYDIVHLHSVYRPLNAIAAVVCGVTGTPYVISPHSGLSPVGRARARLRKAAWIQLVEKPALRGAGRVICLSQQEADDVHALVRDVRTTIVRNPLPPTSGAASRHVGSGSDTPTAVTLARYDVYQKGLDRLVALGARLGDIRFVVYGDVDRNQPDAARRLISEAPGNVTFVAPIHGVQKERVLSRADLYVQLSRWEGQSIALMEAMLAGVPCVVSETVAETLGDSGRALVLAIPDDPSVAAEGIRTLLGDPAELSRLSHEGSAWARRAADPVAIQQRMQAAYIAATGGRRGRPSAKPAAGAAVKEAS